jgi:hypothetical protein
MATFYGPQITQVNEKLPSESSLNLKLTKHPRDEDPEPREVRACIKVKPLRAWYYHISLNSHTMVML